MRSLADFEFNKVPLCDGMILISEMIRDDFTSQYVYAELENLVSLAREEINQARPQDWQLEKLIELFYLIAVAHAPTTTGESFHSLLKLRY